MTTETTFHRASALSTDVRDLSRISFNEEEEEETTVVFVAGRPEATVNGRKRIHGLCYHLDPPVDAVFGRLLQSIDPTPVAAVASSAPFMATLDSFCYRES